MRGLLTKAKRYEMRHNIMSFIETVHRISVLITEYIWRAENQDKRCEC